MGKILEHSIWFRKIKTIKIKEIEKLEQIPYEKYKIGDSPLELWYDRIRDKEIFDLSDADLLRMLRQSVFLNYITDEIVKRLKNNPILGEQQSGEMLVTLSEQNLIFWYHNPLFKEQIVSISKKIIESDFIDTTDELFDFEKTELNSTLLMLSKL